MSSTTTRPSKRQKTTHDGPNDAVVASADRLSRLPNHVVSHILSLLPTAEAFASRRLCRRWFHNWSLDQILDFSDVNDCRFYLQDEFVSFVDRTLSQLDDGSLVQKLNLRRRMYGRRALDRVENWLTLVNERNVKELEIDAVTNEIPYTLSRTVLGSSSLTSLKLANLELKVNEDSPISLNSLKTLSLKYVKSDDESLRKLISSCSSLERLEVFHCFGINELRIRNPNLKLLEIRHCSSSSFFKVRVEEAKSLKTLSYTGEIWSDVDDHYLGELENLTSLRLNLTSSMSSSRSDAAIASLERRISKMPSLEKLEIAWRGRGRARGARTIKISGRKLKNLVVEGLFCNVDVVVDAPYLETVSYAKDFVSVSALNSPKLIKKILGN